MSMMRIRGGASSGLTTKASSIGGSPTVVNGSEGSNVDSFAFSFPDRFGIRTTNSLSPSSEGGACEEEATSAVDG